VAIDFVAFILTRHGGQKRIDEIAVLAYLCDRVAIARLNKPIIGGHYVTTLDGPMISELYDILDSGILRLRVPHGTLEPPFTKQENSVKLIRQPDRDIFTAPELTVVTDVDASFGHMAKHELENWCAQNYPEFGGQTITEIATITLPWLAAILGKTNREIVQIMRMAAEGSALEGLLDESQLIP